MKIDNLYTVARVDMGFTYFGGVVLVQNYDTPVSKIPRVNLFHKRRFKMAVHCYFRSEELSM